MRHQGRITTWKDDKGFGFITPNGGGDQVFLHVSSLASRQGRPVGNEAVTYELAIDGKGRSQAKAVAFVGKDRTPPAAPGRGILAPIFAACFLLVVVALILTGHLPLIVLGFYLVLSLIAFFAYAIDKWAAKNDRWRTQESTLHLFSLLGGWPGALAAQRLLRHKSVKASFQTGFWATVVINCGALGWLVSPSGTDTLRAIVGVVGRVSTQIL